MAAEGLITVKSSFGPEETMNRLEAEVRAKGMTVFAHVDHAAGAAAVGLPLRPTDLLIFGAAKGGTPLMQAVQTHRHRPAAEGAGLAGRGGHDLALLQRSGLSGPSPRPRRVRQRRRHRDVGRAEGDLDQGHHASVRRLAMI